MSGNVDVNNYVQIIVAATIYLGVEQPESALRALHPSDHLECYALKIQALLSIHRPDLAKKELKVIIIMITRWSCFRVKLQPPAKRELLGSLVVRTLEVGN